MREVSQKLGEKTAELENARVRIEKPLHQFMDDWCQQGPSHHIAMGIGDHSAALETFAESMQFRSVRV